MNSELKNYARMAWFIFFYSVAYMGFFAIIKTPPTDIAMSWLYLLGLSLGFALFMTWKVRQK